VGVGDCGESWVLSYEIGGSFHIEETPLGAGDNVEPLTPGVLRIRVPGGEDGPGSGQSHLLELNFREDFEVTSFGIRTTTQNSVQVGPAPCGAGIGDLQGNILTWDACTPGEGFGVDRNSWTPESGASGPGCAQDMRTSGNVHCEGVMCGTAGLEEGDNPQNDRYDQKLNNLVFSADLSTVEMEKVEIPNREPSRTFISLTGTQTGAQRAPIPACLCP
tara:strand:- start:420 stop:1073 length:654 start_codon:yes stop_codon:yes gene_type:complete